MECTAASLESGIHCAELIGPFAALADGGEGGLHIFKSSVSSVYIRYISYISYILVILVTAY